MMFLVDTVQEGVASLLVLFLEELFKVQQLIAPQEFGESEVAFEELSVLGLLKFAELGAFCGNFRH
jgi:hypothetical protein